MTSTANDLPGARRLGPESLDDQIRRKGDLTIAEWLDRTRHLNLFETDEELDAFLAFVDENRRAGLA